MTGCDGGGGGGGRHAAASEGREEEGGKFSQAPPAVTHSTRFLLSFLDYTEGNKQGMGREEGGEEVPHVFTV